MTMTDSGNAHSIPAQELDLCDVRVRRALISVHDKTGVVELARCLTGLGVEILSTGGTAGTLDAAKVPVQELSTLTGFQQLLGGRIKSLHPAVHAGLLARRDQADDLEEIDAKGIGLIDLLVVNFYPVVDCTAASRAKGLSADLIDIGGPAMARSAAKNHAAVTVITDPDEYLELMHELGKKDGSVSHSFRLQSAARAFTRTASYDTQISDRIWQTATRPRQSAQMPGQRWRKELSYGENPHQQAAFVTNGRIDRGLASAVQVTGREPGYNNLLDANAAMSLIAEFDSEVLAACTIIKHGNPCGVAVADSTAEAFVRARECDPLSAFGGVISLNRELDLETANRVNEGFLEVVLAPAISDAAAELLGKSQKIRSFVCNPADFALECEEVRSICGGLLVQTSDTRCLDRSVMRVVTSRAPTTLELQDLEFAWKVARHAKSNAVVMAGNGRTVGIGAGQTSRVAAARIAGDMIISPGSPASLVAASDGFFPFPDGIEAIAKAGATAVIQPGGSRNDARIIAAAEELGLAMVMTGSRHFRH